MSPHPRFELPAGEHTRPVSLGPSPRKPPDEGPVHAPGPQPSPLPSPPVEAPHIELLDHLMDRSEQWRRLRIALAQPAGHLIVTVAGSVQQDLALFCNRVLYFVNEPHPREGAAIHHRVAQVHLRRGGVAARTAIEVENRFVHASGRARGDLQSALRSSAEPWLYILQVDHDPLSGLSDDEIRALEGFFTTRLPAAVQGQPQPVRVLLPIQHGSYEGGAGRDPLCKRLSQALGASQQLPVLALPELTLPSWPEVEHQLQEDFQIHDEDRLHAAGVAFHRARAAADASYANLARAVLSALQPAPAPETP